MNEQALQKAAAYIGSWLDFKYERLDLPDFVVVISYRGNVSF